MSDAVREIINGYLSNVRRRLQHLTENERVAILDSLESHIHEALASRCQEMEPTQDDVRAVLADMDPPEAFASQGEQDAPPSGGKRWLRKMAMALATVFAVSMLLVWYGFGSGRQLYIGRVKLMERVPSGVEVYGYRQKTNRSSGDGPDVYSVAFRKRMIRRSMGTLKLLGIDTTPETLFDTMKIEPIPNSEIIKIEIIEPDPQQAQNEAQALAEGMALTFSEMTGGDKSKDKRAMKIIEEAHVYPVNNRRPIVGSIGALLGQLSLLLLVFIGAAYLWARVQDAARQR